MSGWYMSVVTPYSPKFSIQRVNDLAKLSDDQSKSQKSYFTSLSSILLKVRGTIYLQEAGCHDLALLSSVSTALCLANMRVSSFDIRKAPDWKVQKGILRLLKSTGEENSEKRVLEMVTICPKKGSRSILSNNTLVIHRYIWP